MYGIDGLRYLPDYISPDEETTLLAIIDQQPWITDLKRRVQHYGYRYDYLSKRVDASLRLGNLPDWADNLAARMFAEGYTPERPDQAIINEYHAGQGIASHIDCEPCFGDTILALTLGSACVMDFTHTKTLRKVPILLERGSLVIMQGEARHDWKHGIIGRKSDVFNGRIIQRGRRVSVTLRKVILHPVTPPHAG
jgi:alkylated DNA repair dioxygenase AlkB